MHDCISYSEQVIWILIVVVVMRSSGRFTHYRSKVPLFATCRRLLWDWLVFTGTPGEAHLSYFLTCREWVPTSGTLELGVYFGIFGGATTVCFVLFVTITLIGPLIPGLPGGAEYIIIVLALAGIRGRLRTHWIITIVVIVSVALVLVIFRSAHQSDVIASFLWVSGLCVVDHGAVDINLFIERSKSFLVAIAAYSAP
jgi:hypothetical protein